MLEVVRPGPLATIQDQGRFGYAEIAVPRSGALDQPAFQLANRLVGNPPTHAAIELTLGGFIGRMTGWVAVTGAAAPVIADGIPAGVGVPVFVRSTLEIGVPTRGVRTYLAVAGGIAVPEVLGSRSTDTLSGIGPEPLARGMVLPLGLPVGTPSDVDFTAPDSRELRLRVRFGPRADWFADAQELTLGAYRMGQLNRVGARLTGRPLTRAVTGELPSEGLIAGAVQVSSDGQPTVFLADHPTTGGYPVIAVVHPADLPLLAQARTGAKVVFHGSQR